MSFSPRVWCVNDIRIHLTPRREDVNVGRRSTVWKRKGRGYFTTINREQIPLGTDKKQAHAKLKELLATKHKRCEYTVAQLVTLFLDDCRSREPEERLSNETIKNYSYTLPRWAEACRKINPEELRPLHLKAWLKGHPEWNQTTKSTMAKRVKVWAAWCRREGYLDVNYLQDAIAPNQLKREAADPEDLAKIEAAITHEEFRDFYQVMLDTGERPGELKTLTASGIDWARSTAIVRGKSGERIIGLTPRALAILRRCSVKWPEGSLLRTPMGHDWSPGAIHYHWKRARKAAGIKRVPYQGCVPYHGRHDLHRRWSAAGVSDLVCAAQLGHKGVGLARLSLLASTYAHIQAEPLAAAARQSEGSSARRAKRG
jgi:integrase